MKTIEWGTTFEERMERFRTKYPDQTHEFKAANTLYERLDNAYHAANSVVNHQAPLETPRELKPVPDTLIVAFFEATGLEVERLRAIQTAWNARTPT
jgi:hypothetical protein